MMSQKLYSDDSNIYSGIQLFFNVLLMPILWSYFGICCTYWASRKYDNRKDTVDSGGEMMGVNSIDYFLHTHGCVLWTHLRMYSLYTLWWVENRTSRKIHLHVLIIPKYGSEMFGAKSVDYFLLTLSLCSLNTPGNPFRLYTLGVLKTGQTENTPTCV